MAIAGTASAETIGRAPGGQLFEARLGMSIPEWFGRCCTDDRTSSRTRLRIGSPRGDDEGEDGQMRLLTVYLLKREVIDLLAEWPLIPYLAYENLVP